MRWQETQSDDLTASGRDVIRSDKWKQYFRGFSNPYGTYGPEEYHSWLALAGLEELKVEMTIEEMVLPGRSGLGGFHSHYMASHYRAEFQRN